MTLGRLIRRSLRFYKSSHLAAVAGISVASAVITGALIVGDSVRGTLRARALHRTANAHYAITSGDRFFREELRSVHPSAVPILLLPGLARHASKPFRANDIQVVGISQKYFALAALEAPPLPPNQAFLSQDLAARLGAALGDEIVLRIRKPGEIAGEAAIAPGKTSTIGWRVRVAGVLAPEHGGSLNLRGSGLEAHNVFLPIESVGAEIQQLGKANVLLIGGSARDSQPTAIEQLYESLARQWTLEDAGIEVSSLSNGGFVVASSQIFLSENAVRAVTQAAASPIPVLTYLANLIEHRTNATPYSMITAAGPPYTPPDMREDEIVLSSWLADDLGAGPGDRIRFSYYIPDSGVRLQQATNQFTVRAVVPMAAPHADRSLMPEFPGIREAERTHDWDAGFPLEYTIRDKDEAYWKEQRGTPKAFISPAAGQRIWTNRFGVATSVRVSPDQSVEQFKAALLSKLSPAQVGFSIRDLQAEGTMAANNAQDFGQLFIAFSVFIILSALILIWLLIQFALESRAEEAGALVAVGFAPFLLRRLYSTEMLMVALAGSILGMGVGFVYAKGLLWGLGTVWRDAVGGTLLDLHVRWQSLILGAGIALVLSAGVAWLVVRRMSRRAGRELLAGEVEPPRNTRRKGAIGVLPPSRPGQTLLRFGVPRLRGAVVLGLICLTGAVTLLGYGLSTREAQPGLFFGAGSLLLIGGWAMFWQAQQLRRAGLAVQSWSGLVLQSTGRKPRRSLAAVALLSCGCFVIVAVSGFRLPDIEGPAQRISGTGGFDTIGSSSLPVIQDLGATEGRHALGIESKPNEIQIVSFRVKEGDEASCLNLNRAARPRVLGVNPDLLKARFKFTEPAERGTTAMQWDLLRDIKIAADGTLEIPAIGDANSIRWSMGKAIGESVQFQDENGRPVRLKIVATLENSILQGSLVIGEDAFVRLFPQTPGYHFFLMEAADAEKSQEIANSLTSALEDFGFETVPAVRRLAAFNGVQNTYLSTFQFLGGIGLLVGSAGLGLLVLRNVMERRGELAAMIATGFPKWRIIRLVLEEHLLLLAAGLLIGSVAAMAAVLPALIQRDVAWGFLAVTLALVMVNGVVWTFGAALYAMRGSILDALRKE